MWNELIKKIELQSILVLFITLLFGTILLKQDNTLTTPSGVLGSVSIAVGILYTMCSFFSNQIKESYKDVISEYKSTISTLRSSHKTIQDSYQKKLSHSDKGKETGDFRIDAPTETGTLDN